ncbi:MAG: hypothetical protein AB1756_03035 [Acidobacteriota bacterium]
MGDWKSSLRGDPTEWLLDFAAPSIKYRVLRELLDKPAVDPDVQKAREEVVSYQAATKIARMQKKDGTFGNKIHSSSKQEWEKSMECCLTMLCELGWDRDFAEIKKAVKVLRQFLKTKIKEINFYEYKKQIRADEPRLHYYRYFFKILALGLLSRLGFNDDPKIKEGILEILENVSAFVSDPIAKDPIEKTGAAYPIIRREAFRHGFPFIPDYYTLSLFAGNPWLLDGEFAKINLKKIFDYAISDTYQSLGPAIGLVKTAKGYFAKGWGLELKGIDFYLKRKSLDYFLHIMEMLAKLGLVNRYPFLMNNMDWVMSKQQKDGRWIIEIEYFNSGSKWGHFIRLEKDWKSPNRKIADLTFRILIILKNQWIRQIKMLDRHEDSFPI